MTHIATIKKALIKMKGGGVFPINGTTSYQALSALTALQEERKEMVEIMRNLLDLAEPTIILYPNMKWVIDAAKAFLSKLGQQS